MGGDSDGLGLTSSDTAVVPLLPSEAAPAPAAAALVLVDEGPAEDAMLANVGFGW